MKTTALAIAGVLLASNLAQAETKPRPPDESEDDPAIRLDDSDDTAGDADDATDPSDDEDTPPPRKHHHRDDDADQADEPAAVEPPSRRPERYSIGLGLGYRLPADLKTPNITSARFRLASGVTYEPMLVLEHTSTQVDDGTNVANGAVNDTELAVNVRYPFRRNDRVDFSMVGTVGLARVSVDPSGDANNQTTTTFALGYGLGLDYWINPHWDLSMTALNPFASITKSSQQQGAGARDSTTSQTTIAAIFDPTLSVMIHLYL